MPKPEFISDFSINQAIDRKLQRDALFPFFYLNVSTNRGIVTLAGEVGSLAEKERALMIAKKTRGVRSVVDQISVRQLTLTDDQLAKNVITALAHDPTTDTYELDVQVLAGRVTLRGTVDSKSEAMLAERVVRTVRGVLAVDNEIKVKPSASRPDSEIVADIEARLAWDRRIDAALVEAAVNDGRAVLTGTVGSAAEKSRAAELAWVAGVHNVDVSGIKVDRWWDRGSLSGVQVLPTDKRIAQAIKDAILYDPRVNSFEVSATVRDGVAILTGVVDSPAVKQAASAAARNTIGVERVRNYLRVRSDRPVVPDNKLVEAVKEALARHSIFDGTEIRVAADEGVVFLRGTVVNDRERDMAEAVASRVNGVLEVRNLVVPNFRTGQPVRTRYLPAPRETVTDLDANLRDDIEDEMMWSPYVDSQKIKVAVDDGTATLTGTVSSLSEKLAAVDAAFDAGAERVVDKLEVTPAPPNRQ